MWSSSFLKSLFSFFLDLSKHHTVNKSAKYANYPDIIYVHTKLAILKMTVFSMINSLENEQIYVRWLKIVTANDSVKIIAIYFSDEIWNNVSTNLLFAVFLNVVQICKRNL